MIVNSIQELLAAVCLAAYRFALFWSTRVRKGL